MEWICSICGYVYDGEDFNKEPEDYICPLCDADKSAFEHRDFSNEITNASEELLNR